MTNLHTRTRRSLFATTLMLSATLSFAQVKIGTNPTVITTNANLDVEGDNNTHMVVMKPGLVGINTAAPTTTLHVQAIENNTNWANNVIARFDPFGGPNINSRGTLLINDRTAIGYDIDAQQNKYSYVRGNYGTDFRLQVMSSPGSLQNNAFVMSAQETRLGFIGLNTEAPQCRLDVRGTLKALASSAAQTGALSSGSSNMNGFEAVANDAGDSYVSVQRDGTGANLFLSKPAGTVTGSNFQRFYVGGGPVGIIAYNGSGVAYQTTSDMRLKENIRTSKFGLQALKTVKVYDYNFKTDKNKVLSTGVLAQELHKVYPQAVSVGGADAKTDPWQVDYSKLVPMLVKSVQELSLEVESLKAEKAALTAELNQRVSRLERMLHAEEKETKSLSR